MARYENQPISGFTGHIPGAKWIVGGRSSSMNSLNTSLNQATSQARQAASKIRDTAETESHNFGNAVSGAGQNMMGFMPGGAENMMNSMNGQKNGMMQSGMNSMQNINGQMRNGQHYMQNAAGGIQNYAASMQTQMGKNGSNMREFADQFTPTQHMNHGQGFPSNGFNQQGHSIERGVPMPYMNDSQISQFGFTSQGIPVRINPEYQQEYTQWTRQNGPDGSFMEYNSSQMKEGQNRQGRPPMHSGDRNSQKNSRESRGETTDVQAKRRAQSVPRKVEKDPFEGLEGGLYTKGEVQRNKERREMAMRGMRVQGGEWTTFDHGRPGQTQGQSGGQPGIMGMGTGLNDSLSASQRKNRNYLDDEEDDVIPAAGYSGHIPAMRRIGIGKNFNSAAKEAKKEYQRLRNGQTQTRESSEVLQPGHRNVQFDNSEMEGIQNGMNSMNMGGQTPYPYDYGQSMGQSFINNSRSMNFPNGYTQNNPY